MRVDHVRILGGEPLLHPSLGALLEAVQASDIGTRVRILTNGLLLAEAPDDIWDLTDEIHISVYPNTVSAIERQVTALTTRAQTHATVLVAKYFGYFRVAYRRGGPDDSLTQAIYDTCQIGNVWRCLTVDAGRLYRCPQAVFAHIFAPAPPLIDAGGVDYLEIGSIESVRTLRDWLQRKAPLPSCRTCAGSVGHRHLHQQARPHAEEAMADGIDLAYLAALHDDLNADNACVTRTEVLWAGAQ